MRKAAAAQGVSSINIQQAGAVTLRRQEHAVQLRGSGQHGVEAARLVHLNSVGMVPHA